MDYRNDRNRLLGPNESKHESEQTTSNRSGMNTGSAWSNPTEKQSGFSYYGRDNASMRGNDYYGSQGFGKDYSRRNFSTSTFGQRTHGEQSGSATYNSKDRAYGEGAPYGHSSYGQEHSQSYTDFMDHNYGYLPVDGKGRSKGYNKGFSGYGETGYGATNYNDRDLDRERRVFGNAKSAKSYTWLNQRYSENDGRRR
ncbi:hypothetical protein [Pontibacter oryzae]|uniref:Uncharacterized protein n=1 Tax=Pontibacter oryzae TaxID=2304593 RepID=A0A399SEB7_9BACT|nr:hypothetical protein [Pontibacter oryzae]RIJ42436.1 hypothetical protein D1627_00765 [Pontibacter oryzae]